MDVRAIGLKRQGVGSFHFKAGIQASFFQAYDVQAKNENKFSKVGKMNLRLNFLIDETKADPDRSYSLHWTN